MREKSKYLIWIFSNSARVITTSYCGDLIEPLNVCFDAPKIDCDGLHLLYLSVTDQLRSVSTFVCISLRPFSIS